MRKKKDKVPVSRDALLKAPDGTMLHPKYFPTNFEATVQTVVDNYLQSNKVPDFCLLPLDHSHSDTENKDVDTMSLAIKKAFKARGHNIKTMVMASNLYDYKHVDLAHVGKHLLSEKDEQLLKKNQNLRSKVVLTLGVPSNISWTAIRNFAHYPAAEKVLEKYKSFNKVLDGKLFYGKDAALNKLKHKKNALFSLGGITDNGTIGFDLNDAKRLIESALRLEADGYNVIFTNSPRTPSDVTDYLFEECQAFDMGFFNSKKIAQNADEAKNFRNYSGKHKKEFEDQASVIGNIYPAVLDVCEFVVNTHDSFSYTSDAAVLGIPSVVYTGNFIDRERRPDCYKLFDLCHKGGYSLSLDEAMEKIERGETLKTKKMDDVSTQLIRAMKNSLIPIR